MKFEIPQLQAIAKEYNAAHECNLCHSRGHLDPGHNNSSNSVWCPYFTSTARQNVILEMMKPRETDPLGFKVTVVHASIRTSLKSVLQDKFRWLEAELVYMADQANWMLRLVSEIVNTWFQSVPISSYKYMTEQMMTYIAHSVSRLEDSKTTPTIHSKIQDVVLLRLLKRCHEKVHKLFEWPVRVTPILNAAVSDYSQSLKSHAIVHFQTYIKDFICWMSRIQLGSTKDRQYTIWRNVAYRIDSFYAEKDIVPDVLESQRERDFVDSTTQMLLSILPSGENPILFAKSRPDLWDKYLECKTFIATKIKSMILEIPSNISRQSPPKATTIAPMVTRVCSDIRLEFAVFHKLAVHNWKLRGNSGSNQLVIAPFNEMFRIKKWSNGNKTRVPSGTISTDGRGVSILIIKRVLEPHDLRISADFTRKPEIEHEDFEEAIIPPVTDGLSLSVEFGTLIPVISRDETMAHEQDNSEMAEEFDSDDQGNDATEEPESDDESRFNQRLELKQFTTDPDEVEAFLFPKAL